MERKKENPETTTYKLLDQCHHNKNKLKKIIRPIESLESLLNTRLTCKNQLHFYIPATNSFLKYQK